MTQEKMMEMKLNEMIYCEVDSGGYTPYRIQRVPSGWVYIYQTGTCFVPQYLV
jgi:hypothetical protein